MAQEEIPNASTDITMDFMRVKAFNENFVYSEVKSILSLYTQINNTWQHPLIMNYSYCLICRETVNSPYSIYTLQLSHLQESPLRFMRMKHFKYKIIPAKKRITNRRMIKSQDNIVECVINKQFKTKYEETTSDTDVFYVPPLKPLLKKKKNKQSNKHKTIAIPLHIQSKKKLYQINEKEINFNKQSNTKRNTVLDQMNIHTIENDRLKKGQAIFKASNITQNNNNTTKAKSLMKIFKMLTGDTQLKQSNDESNRGIQLNDILSSKKSNSNHNYVETYNQECCDICLQEIKEKFVLGCGDFYCRKCIQQVVINCIYNIAQFNKLVCPKEICKEKMEERVIEKLLTNEEYLYYTKIKTRVDGLKNKIFIPCPYPDCEHFGKEKEIKQNLLYCGNNHLFCVKCLKVIISTEESSSVIEHICLKNKDDSTRYLIANMFIKKCPNCSTWVQRDPRGCNNMTCTNPWCNNEFCWICNGRYDNAHYKNPFSVCFGLGESDYQSNLSKYRSIRVLKCIIIFMLLIFIVLPIIVNLFSFILISLYLVSFVFDGSVMKNIKINHDWCRATFNFQLYLLYFSLAISLIPLGYLILVSFIVIFPVLIIFNKIKKLKEEDDYYS